jgi:hypothetical protein
MGIRKNDCKGGMGEGAGHYHWSWAASHTCCFSLALLSEVAMLHCSSISQYSSIPGFLLHV